MTPFKTFTNGFQGLLNRFQNAVVGSGKKAIQEIRKRMPLGSKLVKTQIMRGRKDIDDWQMALRSAENVLNPNRVKLNELYTIYADDGTLTSQISNRVLSAVADDFQLLNASGEQDEDTTKALKASMWFETILTHAIESEYFGTSLVQLIPTKLIDGAPTLNVELIDRRHLIPEFGELKMNYYDFRGVPYRDSEEYGVTLLEFGDAFKLGAMNKCLPYLIMKRFNLSSFSEANERYGMPVMVLKTQTDDQVLLSRAESMAREFGSNGNIIADLSEEITLIQAANMDGKSFDTLDRILNGQICLAISGAIIGQDTANGNYSKEESSKELLEKLIKRDKRIIAGWVNEKILPALVKLGFVNAGLRFEYVDQEDTAALWKMAHDAMPFYEVDADWLFKKFGIPVKPKTAGVPLA